MKTLKWVQMSALISAGILLTQISIADNRSSQIVSFEETWNFVQGVNPELKASQSEISAAEIGASRAENHWYPRLFATGQIFTTTDPGANFMYTLEQRQITVQDFSPDQLNRPGSNTFEQAGLGLELPLYEGGSKVAAHRAARLETESKKAQKDSLMRGEFAKLVKSFGLLLSLAEEKNQLLTLGDDLNRILSHYSIGSKSNPVGYSGLLGLQNLKNRIQGLLIQNDAKNLNFRNEVTSLIPDQSLSRWTNDWSIRTERTESFLNRIFPEFFSDSSATSLSVTPQVQSLRLNAEALDESKSMERAHFLPKVGLFAHGDLYAGARDNATNYTGGAYVQWELFNMQNNGATTEANHLAEAAHYHAESLDNQMRAQATSARESLKASRETMKLLDQSANLLEEQTKTARELFRSGSINALQLVEVLNRRADLLENRREAESALVESASSLFLASGSKTEGL